MEISTQVLYKFKTSKNKRAIFKLKTLTSILTTGLQGFEFCSLGDR